MAKKRYRVEVVSAGGAVETVGEYGSRSKAVKALEDARRARPLDLLLRLVTVATEGAAAETVREVWGGRTRSSLHRERVQAARNAGRRET